MTKADKVRAYLKTNPNASPTMTAKVTKVSYGYAYKIVKEEQAKRATAEVVTQHVNETTDTIRPERTAWQKLTRSLRACWKRSVKKFTRARGLYGK